VLVYAKDTEKATTELLSRTDAMNARYGNPDGDVRVWTSSDPCGPSPKTHQGMVYAIQSPFTGELHYPASNSCWRSDKRDMKRWLEEWGSFYVEKDLADVETRSKIIGLPAANGKRRFRGFDKLRAAGIDVEVGGLEGEARRLNEAFARYIRHNVPLVTVKSAMTLDGKIGLSTAASASFTSSTASSAARLREPCVPAGGWITGEAARAHVQQQRHQSGAILVGIGTILADDPLLTDRSGNPRRRPLLRVILDSRLRLPLHSRLVQSAAKEGQSDILVLCASANVRKKIELESCGIRVEQIGVGSDHSLDFHAILRRLGELEITSLLIEGGAAVNASALAADIVDKVFLYYAPKLLGDPDGVSFLDSARSGQIQPLTVKHAQLHRFDEDIAIEGYLRDPYAE